MSFDPTFIALAAAIACLALGTGIWVGRRSGKVGEQIRDLTSRLETAAKDRELAQASLEAARAEISRLESETEQYRGEVVEHFNGASDLMRDLTLQYRAVYDHLTRGATSLCPPGSVGLQEGLSVEQLGAGPADAREGSESGESAA